MTEVCGADAGAWMRELDRLLYTVRSQSQGANCDLRTTTPTPPTISTEEMNTVDGGDKDSGQSDTDGQSDNGGDGDSGSKGSDGTTTKAQGEADNLKDSG